MSNVVDDKELDEYLSGGTQYSRRYRAIDADAVPADLDALVIASADTAPQMSVSSVTEIHSAKARRKRPLAFWMRASIPITIAASLLLALSIQMDSGVRLNSAAPETVALQVPQARPVAEVPTEQARVSAEDTVQMQDMAQMQNAAAGKARDNIESEKSKKESAPLERPLAEAPAALSANQGVVSTDKLAERQRADSAEVIDKRAQDAANAASAPASAGMAPAVVATAPRSETAAKSDAAGTPAMSQENRSAPAQRTARASELEEVMVTGSRINGSNSNNGVGPRGTIPPSSFSEREPSDEELAKQYREANPGSWLGYIRDLRAGGKTRDADREWRRFVKAYPAYKVEEADSARPKK